MVDVDTYEEARTLVATLDPVFLVDPSGCEVGVIVDAAGYQQAEAVALSPTAALVRSA